MVVGASLGWLEALVEVTEYLTPRHGECQSEYVSAIAKSQRCFAMVVDPPLLCYLQQLSSPYVNYFLFLWVTRVAGLCCHFYLGFDFSTLL